MDEGSHREFPRRKRVSRACDRCRSKKDKCDGARPACSTCQASGLPCSYDPHAKKRGLPEGYVRGLEKLWAFSLCNVEGLEDALLAMIDAAPESAGRGPNRAMKLWTDESASESLHSFWKTSRLFGAFEKMLSSTDSSQSLGKRSRGSRDSSGSYEDIVATTSAGSEWGFRVQSTSVPLGLHAPSVVESSTTPEAKRARLSIQPDRQNSSQTGGSTNDALRLPSQTSQLLDIYFTVTHPWLPIVAKHSILKASYRYANPPFSIASTSPGSGDHAALWAILSYTTAKSASQDGPLGALPRTKEYYSVARGLIPLEGESHELGHVQALLLLTLVNIGLENWTAAWLLSGQAVRMVTGLGIDTGPEDKLQNKAVFLGCFVVDTFLSFRLSRTPCMRSKDVDSMGLLEEDGLEEWNSWFDMLSLVDPAALKRPPGQGPVLVLSCFNRLVELASVLNKISCDTSTGSDAYAFAQQLLLELKQWEGHLPLGCRILGPENDNLEQHWPLLPHQSYLCLAYIATLLQLYTHQAPQNGALDWTALENSRKLLYRVLPLASQHMENFKICSFPPIFEMPLRTIAQQAFTLLTKVGSDTFSFVQWADALLQCTSDLGPTWPVCRTLVETIDGWKRSQGPSESMNVSLQAGPANRTLFSDTSSDSVRLRNQAVVATGQRQLESKAPFYPASTPSLISATTAPENAPPAVSMSLPINTYYMTPKSTNLPLQQAFGNSDFPNVFPHRQRSDPTLRSSGYPQPPTPESSLSTTFSTNPSNTMLSSGGPSSTVSARSNETRKPIESRSASDLDSIFKDLAYLDTTEWAVNREAGLRDFGFFDDTTFRAFCHDPDRLAGSQPLVHPPNIADIWPPPGFYPETFQDRTMDKPPGG